MPLSLKPPKGVCSRVTAPLMLTVPVRIRLAISNPCFELWALLHFQDHTAYIERKDARRRLKRHLPQYDKALPFARLHLSYADAVQRAQELERRRKDAGDPGGNPSTGVHKLTEQIRAGGKRTT